ncbi:MAG: hypothetical protein VKL39_24080, partial [Leptolyngbyaceae bacterium]|nr:hypothetical protein [Leptolyngbyaceae bacterium]
PVPLIGAGLKDEPHYWPLQERPAPFMGRRWVRIHLRRGLPNGKYEYGFAAKEGGLIGQSYVDWFGDETLPIEFKGTLVSEPMEASK